MRTDIRTAPPGAARVAALVLLLLGFLPLPNLLRVDDLAWPWRSWYLAWVVSLLGALALGSAAWLRRADSSASPEADAGPESPWFIAAVLSTALLLYLATAWGVFSHKPLHVDEVTQAFQARIFAAGRLWIPTPQPPEFFGGLLVVNRDGRTFAQFPPGWPALLSLGYRAGVPWAIGPLLGVIALGGWWSLVQAHALSRGATRAAVLLFGLSPWIVFNAGSWMNHLPALALLLWGGALLAWSFTRRHRLFTLSSGLCFGLAATIRPLDALAFALPAGLWLLICLVRRTRGWGDLAGFGLGCGLPALLLLGFNGATTGHPLLFGYTAQWGPTHGLGFHAAPWGPPHTPLRGLALLSWYLAQIQDTMFSGPVPVLLAPLLALLLVPRLAAIERYLLASAGLLLLLYGCYWHKAEYLGPRFLLPLAPLVAYWTVRLPGILGLRGGGAAGARHAALTIILLIGAGLVTGLPTDLRRYRAYGAVRRWDADAAARAAGIHDALVLVPEPWGAQVVARLWGLGVARRDAEQFYRTVDLCELDSAVAHLERTGLHGEAAQRALTPLTRDSALLVPMARSRDSTSRMRPDAPYGLFCTARLEAEKTGTYPLLPLLIAGGGDIRYARDLHERTPDLLANQVGQTVYVLRLRRDAVGRTQPWFVPFDADSAQRDWARLTALMDR